MKYINKKMSLVLITILPIILSIVLSLIGDLVYFNYIAFILPIYSGVLIIYLMVKTKFNSEFKKVIGLTLSAAIQHLYSLGYYMYQQNQFDRWCELNNEPKDLDSIIIFFVAAGFNFFIYLAIILTLVGLYFVYKNEK